jgi:hypothetical protein
MASTAHHESDRDLEPDSSEEQSKQDPEKWARDRRLSSLFSLLVFNRRDSLPRGSVQASQSAEAEAPVALATAYPFSEDESGSDVFISADEGIEARWSQTFSIPSTSSGIPQFLASERSSLMQEVLNAHDLAALQGGSLSKLLNVLKSGGSDRHARSCGTGRINQSSTAAFLLLKPTIIEEALGRPRVELGARDLSSHVASFLRVHRAA